MCAEARRRPLSSAHATLLRGLMALALALAMCGMQCAGNSAACSFDRGETRPSKATGGCVHPHAWPGAYRAASALVLFPSNVK